MRVDPDLSLFRPVPAERSPWSQEDRRKVLPSIRKLQFLEHKQRQDPDAIGDEAYRGVQEMISLQFMLETLEFIETRDEGEMWRD